MTTLRKGKLWHSLHAECMTQNLIGHKKSQFTLFIQTKFYLHLPRWYVRTSNWYWNKNPSHSMHAFFLSFHVLYLHHMEHRLGLKRGSKKNEVCENWEVNFHIPRRKKKQPNEYMNIVCISIRWHLWCAIAGSFTLYIFIILHFVVSAMYVIRYTFTRTSYFL